MKPILLAFALSLAGPAFAHQVIGISDGDTLTLLVDQKPLKIRLGDIDAPEKTQAFGERSKQSLSDLCFGRDATYKAQTIDKYGRTVARVTCGGVDVNRAQVERGMAYGPMVGALPRRGSFDALKEANELAFSDRI